MVGEVDWDLLGLGDLGEVGSAPVVDKAVVDVAPVAVLIFELRCWDAGSSCHGLLLVYAGLSY